MSFGGFGGGAPMFGGGGGARSAAAPGGGLPFAGIPPELQEGVDKLLTSEPEYPEPSAPFSYVNTDERSKHLNLRQLIFGHWRLGVMAVILVCIVSVSNQLGPALISYAIDHGMPPHPVDMGVVAVCAGLFLLAILVSALAQRSQARVSGRLAARVMNDLRVKVFTQLQRLGLDYYTQEKAGVIMTRMTSDIENLQQLLQDGLAQLVGQALTMVVITVILFTMNVELTLITLALVIPILLSGTIWFTRASAARLRARFATESQACSATSRRACMACARWRRSTVSAGTSSSTATSSGSTATPTTTPRRSTRSTVLERRCSATSARGRCSRSAATWCCTTSSHTVQLIAFFLYLNRFFAPIQLLVQQYNTFQQGQSSVLKLRTLFRTEPSTPEKPGAAVLPPITGEIVFDHVSFGYLPDQPVLRDVNLRIAPGETVAFVGQTGAGKSTAAKLITRFYDPTEGSVKLDGHDLRDVTIDSLRRQLGVVPQEPFLFAGSLRYNIAFARPEASDEEVWEAVDAVGLREVVERMPDGLDTVVHERGQIALLRRAAADRAGASLPRAPPGAGSRRGHLQPRPALRDEDRGGAGRAARGPHGRADRASVDDRDEGRPHRGGR